MTDAMTIGKALGLARAGRSFTGACPSCGYPSGFSVQQSKGAVLVKCHAGGCSQDDVIQALRAQGLWLGEPHKEWAPPARREPTAPADPDAKRKAASEIWGQTVPAAGTIVETAYLPGRAITLPVPPTLRFLANAKHAPSGQRFPCMVAGFALYPATRVCAIHRTFLTPSGTDKAPVPSPKMTLGPVKGAAIRLAPAGSVLLVGEGIETVLSGMQETGLPGWAAFSAGNLVDLLLPPMVAEVVILVDHDTNGVGQRKSEAAARRFHAEGRRVRLALPPAPDTDFNDLLRAGTVAEMNHA
jgi:hypothetical protein